MIDNVPGDVTESAEWRNGRWQWKVGRDAGSALAGSFVAGRSSDTPTESAVGGFYVPANESPWERITDLRRTHSVIRGGRVYDVDALFRAMGVTRR